MVEILELEEEVVEILSHINNGDNFLLSGGAGSGKTYSLVQLINQLILDNPTTKIACITYTNAAVKEIEERVNHENLAVSTIHDFLWDSIKHFQKELKKSLIVLMNDETSKIRNPEESAILNSYFDDLEDGIQYKEFTQIKEGKISHDEVLILANHLFRTYPKLCDILKDRFDFILVDEYQDTSEDVIEILLQHLKQGNKKNIVGFFGDSMQSIYEDGIGDLNQYVTDIKEVQKTQNRRNPQLIIDLANILRRDIDGINQIGSEDSNAPNIEVYEESGVKKYRVKTGSVKFYYSQSNDVELIKESIGWNLEELDEQGRLVTKILNLTHNLIAPNAGFENLMEIYNGDRIIAFKERIRKHIKANGVTTDFSQSTFGEVVESLKNDVSPTRMMQEFIDANPALFNHAKTQNYELFSKIYLDKDQLVDDKKQDSSEQSKKGSKRDDLVKHLFKIQHSISLYEKGDYNEFIRKTEYKISSISDKQELKEKIEELSADRTSTIEEVINKADTYGICKKDDRINAFIHKKSYVFDRVKDLNFSEFQRLYNYLEGYTPFSTKHKTKGNEFNNVLVILDNGNWNDYNFNYLMDRTLFDTLTPAKKRSFPGILNRTEKIFYVCCTRAKENLAIFFHNPSRQVLSTAEEWFGSENVISI